jgi:hypothetical protein
VQQRQFTNFVLRGEFLQGRRSLTPRVRAIPDPGSDPWVAVRKGHEIEDRRSQTGKADVDYRFDLSFPRAR